MTNSNDNLKFDCEILSLGNELLIGRTVNTNLTWLGKELSFRGVVVTRATICRDIREEIMSVIKEIMSRKPRYLIITGGLGPTFDDIQLECLSRALNLDLKINNEALKQVENFYKKRRMTMTKEREKMAFMPCGGVVLSNSVGAAPGCLLTTDNTTIISLPGVPSEMKAIMTENVFPLIEKEVEKLGLTLFELGFDMSGVPESSLAPLLSEFVSKNPTITFKSHPLGEEGDPRIAIHVYKFDKDKKQVEATIKLLWERIRKTFPNADLTTIGPVMRKY